MIGRVMSACVELTPELEKLVEVELKTGRFLSAADFLSKAALKIARALAQIERGDSVEGDDFFEGLRLRGQALRRLGA